MNRGTGVKKMNRLTILLSHFLLLAIALALPANKIENRSHHDLTTIAPAKILQAVKEEATAKTNKLEKSQLTAKKRDITQESQNQPKYLDNKENSKVLYEGKSDKEFAKVLALRTSPDISRIENSILKAENYGEPASINEYRYYGGEDRKKRTAIYNWPIKYSKRELSLTTDDVIALLSSLQQHQQQQQQQQQKQLQNQYEQKFYYPSLQSQWSNVGNSLDLHENDFEDEDVYNESPENRFEDVYSSERFPHWGNFAKEKRFMVSKRNNYLGKPKLAVPIYRRTIL